MRCRCPPDRGNPSRPLECCSPRQGHNKFVSLGDFGCCTSGVASGFVRAHSSQSHEQECLAKPRQSDGIKFDFADVVAINQNATGIKLIEAG